MGTLHQVSFCVSVVINVSQKLSYVDTIKNISTHVRLTKLSLRKLTDPSKHLKR